MMNLKLRNSLESYNGVPLDALQHIPEISFYENLAESPRL
jgi:hypothetical protein